MRVTDHGYSLQPGMDKWNPYEWIKRMREAEIRLIRVLRLPENESLGPDSNKSTADQFYLVLDMSVKTSYLWGCRLIEKIVKEDMIDDIIFRDITMYRWTVVLFAIWLARTNVLKISRAQPVTVSNVLLLNIHKRKERVCWRKMNCISKQYSGKIL